MSKKPKLSPKEAVKVAFEYLDELLEGRVLNHKLLEGLKYNEHDKVWEVTIGFDIGREKRAGSVSLFDGTREPIREFRIVRIDAEDGTFIELDSV